MIRTLIQEKLDEINDLECGPFLPDGIIEEKTTYFGYTLQKTFLSQSFDKKDVYKLSLYGILERKNDMTSNTLEILDLMSEKIVNKLKELNFKVTIKDIDQSDDLIKNQITAEVKMNETNHELVF